MRGLYYSCRGVRANGAHHGPRLVGERRPVDPIATAWHRVVAPDEHRYHRPPPSLDCVSQHRMQAPLSWHTPQRVETARLDWNSRMCHRTLDRVRNHDLIWTSSGHHP